MTTTRHKSLLQISIFFIIFTLNILPTYASSNDEYTINKIIENHGKNNVVNYIRQKRNGKITIQKNKSFLDVTGKPDITLITAKSINYDLKNLKIDTKTLNLELKTFIEKESKKHQKIVPATVNNKHSIIKKLEHQINKTNQKIRKADSNYERNRLTSELYRLKRKYNERKYNEKHNPEKHTYNKSSQNTRHKRGVGYCDTYKSKLRELTKSTKRHQIFFCKDRTYRSKNPKSCGNYKYSRQYSLQSYKNEMNQLRQKISKYCKS